jgi:hypothetical protein
MREGGSSAHLSYRQQVLLQGLTMARYGQFTDRSHLGQQRVRFQRSYRYLTQRQRLHASVMTQSYVEETIR